MTPEQIRERWPEVAEKDVERIVRYLRGDDYIMSAPQVCTARWDALAWSRWVHFKEEDV